MSLFRAFIGSNPPSLTLFAFLYRRKEKRFVHRYFHPENEKNGLRGSRSTAPKPDFSVVCPFLPKKQEKTSFALVDKRRFFHGAGYRSRTFSGSNPPTANFFRLLCSVHLPQKVRGIFGLKAQKKRPRSGLIDRSEAGFL